MGGGEFVTANAAQSYDAKATFFVTGNNIGKGQINDPSTIYPDIIKVERKKCPG